MYWNTFFEAAISSNLFFDIFLCVIYFELAIDVDGSYLFKTNLCV